MTERSPCRYWQQKGACFYGSECKFSHDMTPDGQAEAPAEAAPTRRPISSLSPSVSEFTPSASLDDVPKARAKASRAAFTEFVPSTTTPPPFVDLAGGSGAEEFVPRGGAAEFIPRGGHDENAWNTHGGDGEHKDDFSGEVTSGDGYYDNGDEPLVNADGMAMAAMGAHGGMVMMMMPHDDTGAYMTHVPTLHPHRRPVQSFFMSENYRAELLTQAHMLTTRLQPEDPRFHELPHNIHGEQYHSIWPLPGDGGIPDKHFPTVVYKVTSAGDGCCYALRRVMGCRVREEDARWAIQPWLELQAKGASTGDGVHPNIIGIRDVFASTDFGDGSSLCFVYDYFPGAVSLASKYLSATPSPLGEDLLWSYICQLVSALVSIHSAGLSCRRLIDPNRILITDRHRIRLNCCGFFDALQLRSSKSVLELQHEDLFALGKLILALACQNTAAVHHFAQSLEFVGAHYTADLKGLLSFLLAKPKGPKLPTIFNVTALISHRLVSELHNTYGHMDYLHGELAKELENGRLFRLICKLGFINERPEYHGDTQWADTGDRYLLKLFRDFVFHQQSSDGSPHVDFGHVVQSLNKLDAGSNEKTLLMSRNEEAMLVVSYADLKRCVNEAFADLEGKKSSDKGASTLFTAPLPPQAPQSSLPPQPRYVPTLSLPSSSSSSHASSSSLHHASSSSSSSSSHGHSGHSNVHHSHSTGHLALPSSSSNRMHSSSSSSSSHGHQSSSSSSSGRGRVYRGNSASPSPTPYAAVASGTSSGAGGYDGGRSSSSSGGRAGIGSDRGHNMAVTAAASGRSSSGGAPRYSSRGGSGNSSSSSMGGSRSSGGGRMSSGGHHESSNARYVQQQHNDDYGNDMMPPSLPPTSSSSSGRHSSGGYHRSHGHR